MTPIPFCDVAANDALYRADLLGALRGVVERGDYVLGAPVAAFEAEAAEYLGVPFAVGVSSGTDALMLSLLALEIGAGDEVILPASTYFADVEAVIRVGATPVAVDVDESGLPCPVAVTDTWRPRTRAVIATHFHGGAADLTALQRVVERAGGALIEDACQAFGARRGGIAAGARGVVGCYSFYPTKVLGGAGDGGLVVCRDAALAERLRSLRTHGANPDDKYRHVRWGHNCRLDSLQAAFLRVKLQHLDAAIAARQARASAYRAAFAGLPMLCTEHDPAEWHTWYAFAIRCARRDALRHALADARIEAPIHFPIPVTAQPAYRARFDVAETPRAAARAATILSLPCGPTLTPAQQARVIDTVHDFFRARAPGRNWRVQLGEVRAPSPRRDDESSLESGERGATLESVPETVEMCAAILGRRTREAR